MLNDDGTLRAVAPRADLARPVGPFPRSHVGRDRDDLRVLHRHPLAELDADVGDGRPFRHRADRGSAPRHPRLRRCLKTSPSSKVVKDPTSYRAPPSPPGAVFTKVGLAALPVRHSWAKEA